MRNIHERTRRGEREKERDGKKKETSQEKKQRVHAGRSRKPLRKITHEEENKKIRTGG